MNGEEEKVTYHEACHLCHGQKITRQPRAVLRAIPGLQLVELPESKHEPFLESDPIRNFWLDRVDRFISERLDLAGSDQSRLRTVVQ